MLRRRGFVAERRQRIVRKRVIDEQLNAQKYIVPGLGDSGDRLYGTI